MYARLLAKSSRTPDRPLEAETLAGHLSLVTRVAVFLTERWGEQYLASLGLDSVSYLSRLHAALPRAAFLHDLGKANDHFQRMLRDGLSAPPQACWHEQLSVWLTLHYADLGEWLFAACDRELAYQVQMAAIGHHLRLEDASGIGIRERGGAVTLSILAGHPDFSRTLTTGAEILGLSQPPVLGHTVIDLIESDVFDSPMHRWAIEAVGWWRSATRQDQRFVAALKALVIAADLAGSALPRSRADPVAWARKALARVCTSDQVERVVRLRLGPVEPRPFQRRVQTTHARVAFVRAGCGSGKTAAAYLWAAGRADGRKLFFCYPTTGTASQGFADYVPPDVVDAALVHSRAIADLEDLLMNGAEDRRDQLAWLTRFAALGAWGEPIVVCTADTVLGLIQNNRKGLFSFPSIANGAFVFDEVHQYDDRLFGSLVRFLEAFPGVPTLLMTASLPRSRLRVLDDTVEALGERLEVIDGPPELEQIRRYRIEVTDEAVAWRLVDEAQKAGQRVLWVANTVDRAVKRAQRSEATGQRVLPYHSRYRYGDRLARHRDVVEAFAPDSREAVLAITTQVCEVSLDISADLLVTDLAPVPALIQRMGRLNRRVTPEAPGRPASALVLEPPGVAPYEPDELALARSWLNELGTGTVSQADLVGAFEEVSREDDLPEEVTRSAWLNGGLLATPAALREESTTIPLMREEDARVLPRLAPDQRAREIVRLTIPMPLAPVSRELRSWRREAGVLIAPAGRMAYSERFGGRWT